MSAQSNHASKTRDVLVMSLQMVLGVIAGVVVCAGWLVFKPVTIMDSPPDAKRTVDDRHEVIYVRGKAASRGSQSTRKQKAFLNQTPGELVFVEEDVNRWFAGVYGSKERTFPVQGIGVTFGPRVPAVRLIGDELELGLEIGMDREGGARTIVAQARGRFIERGGKQVFVPRKVYLGSCPLPWNLGGRQLYQKLMGLYPVGENAHAAWSAVGHAAIVENRLHVVMGSLDPAVANTPAPAPVPETMSPAMQTPAAVTSDTTSANQPVEAAPAGSDTPAPTTVEPSAESTVPAATEPPPTTEQMPPTEAAPAPAEEAGNIDASPPSTDASTPAEVPPAEVAPTPSDAPASSDAAATDASAPAETSPAEVTTP